MIPHQMISNCQAKYKTPKILMILTFTKSKRHRMNQLLLDRVEKEIGGCVTDAA